VNGKGVWSIILGLVEDVLGNVIVNTDTEPAKAGTRSISL